MRWELWEPKVIPEDEASNDFFSLRTRFSYGNSP